MSSFIKRVTGGSRAAAARGPGSAPETGITPGEQGSNQPEEEMDDRRSPRRGRRPVTPLGGRRGNM